jgi:2-polyprenyl-3-methyl-5-hydroxy-6-metoxy-1,4-benzoquinol methylase
MSTRIRSRSGLHGRACPQRTYAAIFALDSLEHNEDVRPLPEALADSLQPDGILMSI